VHFFGQDFVEISSLQKEQTVSDWHGLCNQRSLVLCCKGGCHRYAHILKRQRHLIKTANYPNYAKYQIAQINNSQEVD
jgi:hypothetical protein